MLFVKRRRILVTCSRRHENPAGIRLSPSLSFFLVSEILVMQMRGGGTSQLLYKGGRADRPAAGRPGGPAAPLPGDRPPGTCAQLFEQNFLYKSPCRPAAGRPGPGRPAAGRSGYIPVNFQIKIYFCKK